MNRESVSRWAGKPSTSILIFLVAALYGVVVTPLLVRRPAAEVFNDEHFRTWLITLVVQALFWIVATLYVWMSAPDISREGYHSRYDLVLAAIAAALLISPPMFNWLPGGRGLLTSTVTPSVPINLLLGFVAMVALSWGIFRIHRTAQSYVGAQATSLEVVQRYLECQRHLKNYLGFAGGIVASGIIGTSASSLSSFRFDGLELVTPAELLQWAVFSSVLLSTVYIAGKSALSNWGEAIREPMPVADLTTRLEKLAGPARDNR